MVKKIGQFIVLFSFFFNGLNSQAFSHIVLPPKKIHYICRCKEPLKDGLCRLTPDYSPDKSINASPKVLKLHVGWQVQLANCQNNQRYVLTAGAELFAGKKIRALYSAIASPLSVSGYVYHVVPSMPFTKENYSLTVVSHPGILGIDLHNAHGWQCGVGNRRVSCYGKFHIARCFVGNNCRFRFKVKK